MKETITITTESSIQSSGYNLFIINPDRKWQLSAESEETCKTWYKNLRATYIEICESIDVDAFANQEPEAAALPSAPAGVFGPGSGAAPDATAAAAAAAESEKAKAVAAEKATAEKEAAGKGAAEKGTGVTAAPAAAPTAATEELSPEAAAAAKAEKRAAAREKMAAKRAAAKAERANDLESQLKEIFAWIDALVVEDDAPKPPSAPVPETASPAPAPVPEAASSAPAAATEIIQKKLSSGTITAEEAEHMKTVNEAAAAAAAADPEPPAAQGMDL